LKHRRDARAWKAWAQALPEGWSAAADATPLDAQGTTASLAGLPILSERVTFLIDLSGSMAEERADGSTRKAGAQRELERALRALPATARFNVVPYANDPQPWRKSLVAAEPKNVADALAAFAACSAGGKGNLWDAALLALADPEVDTLVLLSDGAPSGGARWNLELIRALFAERNRFRRVVLDCALVDPGAAVERYWREIAADCGGRVHRVSL
jgi:hypothetical protein